MLNRSNTFISAIINVQYVAAMGADLQEEEDEDEEQVENHSQMHFVNLVKSN